MTEIDKAAESQRKSPGNQPRQSISVKSNQSNQKFNVTYKEPKMDIDIKVTPGIPIDYRGYNRKLRRALDSETFAFVSEIYTNLDNLISQAILLGRQLTIPLFKKIEEARETLKARIGTDSPVKNFQQLVIYSFKHPDATKEYIASIGKQDEYQIYINETAKPIAKEITKAIKNDPELASELEANQGYTEADLEQTIVNAAASVKSSKNVPVLLILAYKAYLKNKATVDKIGPSWLPNLGNTKYRELLCRDRSSTDGYFYLGFPSIT